MSEYGVKEYTAAQQTHSFYCYECKGVRTMQIAQDEVDEMLFCPKCKSVMVGVETGFEPDGE